ncbi:PLP-dependent transferase [Pseudovirgaria hyperparasitica]|uniref:PLP-dependent transferase n=1 Tax=Pseudovirgaria hyperparasitica TaxID=470096 RepID=A0A6A6W4D5_9PEZI|nr:PLP-dependent transferase [Pseudovirgaria hyperparasitica]KAF2756894.1 PLP-dependent transferase [Pseudovirgaria hyperparasitica]
MSNFSDVAGSATSKKPLINLLRGWPHPSLLPTKLLQTATQNVLSNPVVSVPGMLYGTDAGFQGLRDNIAKWLTGFYHSTAGGGSGSSIMSADRIAITGGASQNMGCILSVYTDPSYTRNVWCVAPTYMLVFRVFEDAGLKSKLRAVPEDEEGIDIDFLRRELQKSELDGDSAAGDPQFKPPRPWGKIYRHIIYAVPTFSNPSFKTMSLRRREALVRVAREFDALVVTDDVYDVLQWPNDVEASAQRPLPTAVLPRIVDVDRYLAGGAEREGADGFGNAASNGSFSKIAGPGLRTGWVEGTAKFSFGVSQAGTSRSGGAPSQLTSTFVSDMLETGALQTYILDVLQPAYSRRYRTMLAAIQTYLLPLGVALPQTDREVVGGYFIWLTLPHKLDSDELVKRATEEENLVVAGGRLFEVPGDTQNADFSNDIRLCFAWEDEDRLREGIERLATVIRGMLKGGNASSATSTTDEQSSSKKPTSSFW